MADDDGNDLHAQIFELLLGKVRDDPFPSTTMLDMIELMIRPEQVEEYASVLMEKVSQENFPSLDHLRRLQSFV
jgi:hypothetical protein